MTACTVVRPNWFDQNPDDIAAVATVAFTTDGHAGQTQ